MEKIVLWDCPRYTVCVKPQGVDSQTAMPALLSEQTGHSLYWAVHRLDKETGGVMVYAKTKESAADLSRQIAEGELHKTYLAVVGGTPESPTGEWENLLFHDVNRNKSYAVSRFRKGVKKARLAYEMLDTAMHEGAVYSLLSIRLYTGRTHQIRVQCASRKLPLWGDRKYGGVKAPTLGLWSHTLCFDGKTLQAPLPKETPWCWFAVMK